MPNQVLKSVENNFTKGLLTEFTGLNFPENAATDADNCEFTIVGDTTRRLGIDYEENFTLKLQDRTDNAVSSYKWNNAGGDGLTEFIVEQVGTNLYFYKSSMATIATPLSTTRLPSSVDLSSFTTGTIDATLECQYADGNGYLIVFHPSCDPIFCSFTSGDITAAVIPIKIRDFTGIHEDNTDVNVRPLSLTSAHSYNLTNQGWTSGAPWQAFSSTVIVPALGSKVFTVAAGLGVTLGDAVKIVNNHEILPGRGIPYVPAGTILMSGTVTAYAGTSLTVNVTAYLGYLGGNAYGDWQINPTNSGYLNTWNSAVGNYPSNADVWWYFKNTSGIFDPATTNSNISLNTGRAPSGHFILNAFNQTRSLISGVSGLTDITTTVRPRTGAWFQGRVWYAGVDAQQTTTGSTSYYTWTENIYFSQIVKESSDFGNCYQTNDPTSENLFDLLQTDGGVIQIQGCGSIYKLFPIQNGMLVFAANGIWFITGSQGIGFTANDYTITKISAVQSISGTSFINVNGLPYFWNEEGIYDIEPAKGGGLQVMPLTVGTILSLYTAIPTSSKKYVRGAYHPLDYTIQWVYKDTEATDVTDRYTFNRILNFNTYNKAFYTYTVASNATSPTINGIVYVSNPGGSGSPDPVFKYIASQDLNMTFAEEYDDSLKDWGQTSNLDYSSYFVTGYKLHGDAQRRFQLSYLYTYSRGGDASSFYIQGLWDYATTASSGRWSTAQLINNWSPNFGVIVRRHKIRGQGLVLQLKVSSLTGQPFDIMGWSAYETQNTGV